jgi:hypothetical protein
MIRIFSFVLLYLMISNCTNKANSFFNSYQKFIITIWGGESFIFLKRELTETERLKLKNVF